MCDVSVCVCSSTWGFFLDTEQTSGLTITMPLCVLGFTPTREFDHISCTFDRHIYITKCLCKWEQFRFCVSVEHHDMMQNGVKYSFLNLEIETIWDNRDGLIKYLVFLWVRNRQP